MRTPATPTGHRCVRPPAQIRRHGLALVEVVISIAILGGLMGAVLNAVGKAAVTRARTMERVQGSSLAECLMAEILSKTYDDATPAAGALSVNVNILGVSVSLSSPSGDPSRMAFDGIDDYDGWRASPPLARDGSVIGGYSGWTQQVEVDMVSLASPGGATEGADTGLKRITVVILRDGREISRMVAVRSRAWEEALDAR